MTVRIQTSGKEIIILKSTPYSYWLDESEQREAILWFKKNKPEILRDIMCEECPEHLAGDR